MQKLILSFLLSAAFLMPAYAGGEQLMGVWKSDKKATLDYLRQHTQLKPEVLAKIDPTLGKTVLSFDGRTMTQTSGDWQFATKYVVIKDRPTAVVIQTYDAKTKVREQTKLELDKTGFWVCNDKVSGFKERFEKVTVQ